MNYKREPKNRKVTLGFKPSVFKAFQQIAYVQNTSANSILSDYMDKYVLKHQDKLKEYKRLCPEQK